jgi:UDP-glucuronate 4-epimerase
MNVLVTGAAGFIGMHVVQLLLARGDTVLGIDNLNDYYDVSLKRARLDRLLPSNQFKFVEADIADRAAMEMIGTEHEIDAIVHLAAQAGVCYSLENPRAYIDSNIVGQINILEMTRAFDGRVRHLVYASSSSVYGGNTKLPFSVEDRVDSPISLYAATKKADELMGHAYSHIYRLPMTGLRFFTVYGPWGRPDMAAYIFAKKIMAGQPIQVFNDGDMRRDFTFIDDIAAGVIATLDRPPGPPGGATPQAVGEPAPARVYNLGNNNPVDLMRFIELIEDGLGKKAEIEFLPLQPGDVKETYADIEASTRDLGYEPKTGIEDGIARFVAWFKDYHGA